ncbi:MAG TPA: TetR/AcrR family transcriptional regulator [bacterium]|nr:TetR/AcrR family transcriptional regulator [bacterium]
MVPRISLSVRTERRQQILDAAWRCASHKGFRAMSVDEICAEAGLSKGAFYGYFESKQALLLALLADDAEALDRIVERLESDSLSSVDRLRQFVRAMLGRGDDPARVQVRADLWAEMLTDKAVRERFTATVRHRRMLLRAWVERAIADGELVEIPANAFAAVLLALSDGLILHGGLDPSGFRWTNIRKAVDVLLERLSGHA